MIYSGKSLEYGKEKKPRDSLVSYLFPFETLAEIGPRSNPKGLILKMGF